MAKLSKKFMEREAELKREAERKEAEKKARIEAETKSSPKSLEEGIPAKVVEQTDDMSQHPKDESFERDVEKDGADVSVIFWSRAERLRIANYIPELYSGAKLIRREQSVKFEEHLLVTANPKMIEFIRNSSAYKAGDCVEVKNIAEARKKTAVSVSVKVGVRDFVGEDIESVNID